MVSSSDHKDWPDYLPGPRGDLMALGVICLNYGQLENMFQILFAEATGMTRDQVLVLFHRLANNIRENVMLELLEKAEIPNNLKELVHQFAKGFKICADNRHGLMHSYSGGTVTSYERDHHGFVFTRFSRSGQELVCTPTLAELRAAADDMNQWTMFCAFLGSAIHSAKVTRLAPNSTWLPPSLDKYPLPALLNWRSQSDFQAEILPPGSSPA